jgi:antitoxin component YwqK of YwqJK toxin-antitoxin module
MAQNWYYTKDGKKKTGPVSETQLKELVRSGAISANDMVRNDAMQKWIPAGQVKGLFKSGQQPVGSPQPAAPPATVPVVPVPECAPTATSPKVSPPPLPTPSPSASAPWWRRFLDEAREVGKATWAQTVCLVKYGAVLWRGRSARREATSALRALGERMFRSGVGDPQVRSQIAALEDKVRQAEAAKQPTKALNAERESLLLRLAEPALTQKGIIKPAEAEHQKALDTQATLQQHAQATTAARKALPPPDKTGWRRVAIGYALCGCFFLLILGLMSGGDGTRSGHTPDFSNADYSVDFSKVDYSIPQVDYSKGPGGQKLVEQDGRMPGGQQTTDQGFVDPQRGFIIHGLRIVWYNKGEKKAAEEYWFDGKKHGPIVSWDERGQKRLEAGCREGLQHGRATVWDASGKVSEEAYYVMGKKHGTFKNYYPNGQVRQDGAFKSGEYHGKWVSFHNNGKQMSEEYFVSGKKHGKVVAWYDNGQKSLERSFVEGRKEGSHVEWYKNGQKKLETEYGPKQTWSEWKEDGTLFMSILFINDRPQFMPRNVTRDVFIRLMQITADSANVNQTYQFVSEERFIWLFGEPNAGRRKHDWQDRSDDSWLYKCSDGDLMLTAVFTTSYFVISRVEKL